MLTRTRTQLYSPWERLAVWAVLLVALLVRVERAWHEPAVNPDVVRFITQAQHLAQNPLQAVRQEVYHPLHSALTGVAHALIAKPLISGDGALFPADPQTAWIAATKIVGIASALVVTWLVIAFARHFGAPWWAAAGAGLVWALGRRTALYGADGMSDMLFLALFGLAILVAMRTRFRFQFFPWLLVGALAGLSYLTRPEGAAAVVIIAAAILLYALRWHPLRWRRRTRITTPARLPALPRIERAAACAGVMLAGFLLVSLPYMAAIGQFTAKKSLTWTPPTPVAASAFPTALTVPVFDLHAWQMVGMELWETFGFAPSILLGLAMAVKPRLWGRPHWRPLVFMWISIWLGVMLWLIGRAGYLDGRHTLVMLLVLHALLALALQIALLPMTWWQNLWRRSPYWHRLPAWMRWPRWPALVVAITLLLVCLPGLAALAKTPERERLAVRQAANWVRDNLPGDATIISRDPRIAYYAGKRHAHWEGNPRKPQWNLIQVNPALPALLVYTAQPGRGEPITPRIADFRILATFNAPGAAHGDVVIIYGQTGLWGPATETPSPPTP